MQLIVIGQGAGRVEGNHRVLPHAYVSYVHILRVFGSAMSNRLGHWRKAPLVVFVVCHIDSILERKQKMPGFTDMQPIFRFSQKLFLTHHLAIDQWCCNKELRKMMKNWYNSSFASSPSAQSISLLLSLWTMWRIAIVIKQKSRGLVATIRWPKKRSFS